MKKLLFLIVSMVVVGSASAQVLRNAIQNVPSGAVIAPAPPVEKELSTSVAELPSYFNRTVVDNVPMFSKKPQKAGNYLWTGYHSNLAYAYYITNTAWGSTNEYSNVFTLFPDSLAVSYLKYTNYADSGYRRQHYPAIGFVYDPYSFAYGSELDQRLLADEFGALYRYRIDTLVVRGEYRVANYDPLNPDKIRVYVSHHNAYWAPDLQQDPNENYEYLTWFREKDNGNILTPIVKYGDRSNIPAKGSVVEPVAASTIMKEYTLSLKDSADMAVGYIGYRSMAIPLDNYEVPVGHVVSVIIKFIPGYDYNEGDTIRKTEYNSSSKDWISEDTRKNSFGVPVIASPDFKAFVDQGEGFNGRLMEDMDVRYDSDSTYRFIPRNPNNDQAYIANYYAIPLAGLGISVDTTDAWDPVAVTEVNPIVSKIYPNPAANQVKIELINSGAAELSIVNMLGQAVTVATLNEMDNMVDISSLNPGVYTLKVSQSGNVYTTRFIKR